MDRELNIPLTNGRFATSQHEEPHVKRSIPFIHETDNASNWLPVHPRDVASDNSHIDLTSSASEIAVPSTGEQEDDVEEDLLRAQLLMSLARKRKEKENAEVSGIYVYYAPLVRVGEQTFLHFSAKTGTQEDSRSPWKRKPRARVFLDICVTCRYGIFSILIFCTS